MSNLSLCNLVLTLLFALAFQCITNAQNTKYYELDKITHFHVIDKALYLRWYEHDFNRCLTTKLIKTDSSLNHQWTYDLNQNWYNSIERIEFRDNEIYILSSHGRSMGRRDSHVLTILSSNGHLIKQLNLNRSGHNVTNFIIKDDKLIFALKRVTDTISTLEVDLTTNEQKIYDYPQLYYSTPFSIVMMNDQFFLTGNTWNLDSRPTQQAFFVLRLFANETTTEPLHFSDDLVTLNSVVHDGDFLYLISICNEFRYKEVNDRFLSIKKFDLTGNLLESQTKSFPELGWLEYHKTYNDFNTDWFVVTKNDSSNYLVQLDQNGLELRSIPTTEGTNDYDYNAYTITDSIAYHIQNDPTNRNANTTIHRTIVPQ